MIGYKARKPGHYHRFSLFLVGSSLIQFPSNEWSRSSNGNGQPWRRSQLCLLIRQYNLDANLVNAYAADFCGTETLRELLGSFT